MKSQKILLGVIIFLYLFSFNPVFAEEKSLKNIYLTLDMDLSQKMLLEKKLNKVNYWYDPSIFQYIENEKIPVTFFISGLFAETYPQLLGKLNKNPLYTFQNHSYDESGFHSPCYHLNILKTDKEKINQIKITEKIIQSLSGTTSKYFRYPGICHSSHDDDLVTHLGYKISNGDLIPGDPFNKKVTNMVRLILKGAKDGSVIIMHVGGPNSPKSLEVLKQIIPILKKEFIFLNLKG